MAGSDKVDPAIPCLLAMFAHHVCSPCLLAMSALASANANRRREGGRGGDGFPGFQSLKKMLARGLDINVAAAMCVARAGASE